MPYKPAVTDRLYRPTQYTITISLKLHISFCLFLCTWIFTR